MSYSLSILIPSYSRVHKLYRTVLYFVWLSKHCPDFFKFTSEFGKVQLLIADGTPRPLDNSRYALLQHLLSDVAFQAFFDASLNVLPEKSYFERLAYLSSKASSRFVTMLGDEDLLAFDSIEFILRSMSSDNAIAAISGAHLDVKGFSRGRLRLSPDECFLNAGFEFTCKSSLLRLSKYLFQSHLGAPSISFSVMRAEIFKEYTSRVLELGSNISLTGSEWLLNFLTLAHGNVIILDSPFLIRDFSMSGHHSQIPFSQPGELWNDTIHTADFARKYFAELMVEKHMFDILEHAIEFLSDMSNVDFPARLHLQTFAKIAESTSKWSVLPRLHRNTLKAVFFSWLATYSLCFPRVTPESKLPLFANLKDLLHRLYCILCFRLNIYR